MRMWSTISKPEDLARARCGAGVRIDINLVYEDMRYEEHPRDTGRAHATREATRGPAWPETEGHRCAAARSRHGRGSRDCTLGTTPEARAPQETPAADNRRHRNRNRRSARLTRSLSLSRAILLLGDINAIQGRPSP